MLYSQDYTTPLKITLHSKMHIYPSMRGSAVCNKIENPVQALLTLLWVCRTPVVIDPNKTGHVLEEGPSFTTILKHPQTVNQFRALYGGSAPSSDLIPVSLGLSALGTPAHV